jgi:hypothetical protein
MNKSKNKKRAWTPCGTDINWRPENTPSRTLIICCHGTVQSVNRDEFLKNIDKNLTDFRENCKEIYKTWEN